MKSAKASAAWKIARSRPVITRAPRACAANLRHRAGAVRQHADRRGIHQPDGAAQGVRDAVRHRHAPAAAEPQSETRGFAAVGIEEPDRADAEAGQGEGDRLADPAGADNCDRPLSGRGDEIAHGAGETGRIGVVADQPMVADDDRVHRAHGSGARR